MSITQKQSRFISEYLVCGNASEAARRAGYRAKSARQMASENLSKPAILEEMRRRQNQISADFQIKREDVVRGLLEAIAMGREQQNPAVMIGGCVQLAKLCGFFEPERVGVTIGADLEQCRAKFKAMSDAELLEIIAAQE